MRPHRVALVDGPEAVGVEDGASVDVDREHPDRA